MTFIDTKIVNLPTIGVIDSPVGSFTLWCRNKEHAALNISGGMASHYFCWESDFSILGNSFEEPEWRNGRVFMAHFQLEFPAKFVIQVADSTLLDRINPHYIRICCNVGDLYENLQAEASLPISTTVKLPRFAKNDFAKQPIISGKSMCVYQVRYRL